MTPTKEAVEGLVVKDIDVGETSVTIYFTDGSWLFTCVDGFDDGLEVQYEE